MTETAIRQRIDDRVKSIRAKDVDGATSFYARDIVSFDLAHPTARCGRTPGLLRDWTGRLVVLYGRLGAITVVRHGRKHPRRVSAASGDAGDIVRAIRATTSRDRRRRTHTAGARYSAEAGVATRRGAGIGRRGADALRAIRCAVRGGANTVRVRRIVSLLSRAMQAITTTTTIVRVRHCSARGVCGGISAPAAAGAGRTVGCRAAARVR